jgi:membrane protease YdiL (CAAX protease family)
MRNKIKLHFTNQTNSSFDLFLFLGIGGIALFSYWLFYQLKGPALILSGIGFSVLLILFYRRLYYSKPLVRNSITFFLILFFAYPVIHFQMRITGLSFPGANCILPFLIFFILTTALKTRIGFPGYLLYFKKDNFSLCLLPAMFVFSSIALVLWVVLIHPDLTAFFRMIPHVSLPLLCLLGILFALSNAFAEEMLFRGFLFEGLSAFIDRPAIVIFLQAILFGVWHYYGFPGGMVGSAMVFIWAIFLGMMRQRSKSIWYPIIGHVFADLTIFLISYYLFKRHFGG